jgi:hypothetical protein
MFNQQQMINQRTNQRAEANKAEATVKPGKPTNQIQETQQTN